MPHHKPHKARTNNKPAILAKETLLLYWQEIRKDRLKFWIMTICIPLASLALDTMVPYFLSQAVGMYASAESHAMSHMLWSAGVFVIVGVVLNLVGFQAAVRHEAAVRTRLVRSTLTTLIEKEQSFFANQKIGALTGKFIDFVSGHIGIQDLVILRTVSFIINIVIGLVIIATHALPLAGIIVGLLIGLYIQIRVSRKLRNNIRDQRKRLISEVNGTIADIITNNLTVKTFAGEDQEISRTDMISRQYEKAYRKDFMWMSLEGSGRILFMQAFQIIAIVIIGLLLFNGKLSLAIAIFVVAYLQRLSAQLFTLGELINGYDKVLLAATPMTEILSEPPKIIDHSTTPLHVVNGAITLDHVRYAYSDDKDTHIINNMNLEIPAGQKVGLVGVSGAGKTTLTRLILRFDDIKSGRILIDGQNIAKVTQKSLREAIAYVSQEPLLFHRTLRENIAYSQPDTSEDTIRAAAKQANALNFIEKLPHGFDTIVGERGIKLSGGQRQRVAIARAILKNAPILLLDEATSALDSESEKLIQQSLGELMRNRTSIVIAHRLSTIAKLDRIIVLDSGKIIEDGTHHELIARGGTYANLWKHQSGGFIEE